MHDHSLARVCTGDEEPIADNMQGRETFYDIVVFQDIWFRGGGNVIVVPLNFAVT